MKEKFAALILSLGCLSSGVNAAEGDATGPASQTESTSASAAANDFANRETVCKNGAMVRRVKIGFTDVQAGGDCKVSYLKETEEPGGTEKVLWNARQEPNFCAEKAQGFVDKLKGMGWSCE